MVNPVRLIDTCKRIIDKENFVLYDALKKGRFTGIKQYLKGNAFKANNARTLKSSLVYLLKSLALHI